MLLHAFYVLVNEIDSRLINLFGCLYAIVKVQLGLSGLEPPTSRLSGVRSNQLSYKPWLLDGAEEIRTLDPLLARQVLSQLSYNP